MDEPATTVKKRSVVLAGHRTSISLEAEFWQALREVARVRGVSVNALVAGIDAGRGAGRAVNLSSALRVFILDCYRTGELSPQRSESGPAEHNGELARESDS